MFNPLIQENNKLQDEKNKLLTIKNTLESQVNTMKADSAVVQDRVNNLQNREKTTAEKNISLQAEIKRLKNSIADGQEDKRTGPEVFFGFTRTEMAQFLSSVTL
ncbi:hypothetical protein LOD99_6198 [Oopsacas minuta]|uniref:Uncharacterized protein n=1 Tax=Oopsacas minuta TaxID=111878 RepID=A0AAV7JMG7_9METZ|nr:hypothetical protein LOD99_6198 [Oopsacas minuta]